MEFWSIDDVAEVRQFTKESLKVISSLLNEHQVLIPKLLLRWHPWNRAAWPSFGEQLMQDKELIEASLAFEHALIISSLDLVYDVTTLVLWVAYSEFSS